MEESDLYRPTDRLLAERDRTHGAPCRDASPRRRRSARHPLCGTRAELLFAAAASVRERLETIVEKETRCCPFLKMRLSENAGVITLHVQAPEGAEAILSEITGAFGDRTEAVA